MIPANLIPSAKGFEQPYFFIDSVNIPQITIKSSLSVSKYKATKLSLAYTSQTIVYLAKGSSTGYSTVDPIAINGLPVFSRYLIDKTSASTPTYKMDVNGSDLVSMLSSHIRSNITGSISLYIWGEEGFIAEGNLQLQEGTLTGGNMAFYGDKYSTFVCTSKWYIM